MYLLKNPNPNGNAFYTSRRTCSHGKTKPHLVVIHTAENLPDWTPPDTAAESVARYASTTTRKVSWHSTVDSDSIVPMLPDEYVAFHVRGYNTCSLGVELATQANKWVGSPEAWRLAVLENTARVVADWCEKWGINPIRIPRSVADAGGAGIIAHADLDPTRRSDPGPSFPWNYFVDRVRQLLKGEEMTGTPITGPASASVSQAVGYWEARYASKSKYTVATVRRIVAAYWMEAPKVGVDPAIAFAQALKETGGFAYGNLVQPDQWNFAGIGATGPGKPGIKFADIEEGVRAHVRRLAMYAKGDRSLYDLNVLKRPLPESYWGVAPVVEKLNGKWAVPGEGYGESLRDHYWKSMRAFKVAPSSGNSGTTMGEVPPLTADEIRQIRALLVERRG